MTKITAEFRIKNFLKYGEKAKELCEKQKKFSIREIKEQLIAQGAPKGINVQYLLIATGAQRRNDEGKLERYGMWEGVSTYKTIEHDRKKLVASGKPDTYVKKPYGKKVQDFLKPKDPITVVTRSIVMAMEKPKEEKPKKPSSKGLVNRKKVTKKTTKK